MAALAARLKTDIAAGARFEEAWNRSLVEVCHIQPRGVRIAGVSLTPSRFMPRTNHTQVYHVSNVHCRLTLVRNFHDSVHALQSTHATLYPVLKRLADLFALYWIEQVRLFLWRWNAFTTACNERV